MKKNYVVSRLIIISMATVGILLTLGIGRVNALATICNSSPTATN